MYGTIKSRSQSTMLTLSWFLFEPRINGLGLYDRDPRHERLNSWLILEKILEQASSV